MVRTRGCGRCVAWHSVVDAEGFGDGYLCRVVAGVDLRGRRGVRVAVKLLVVLSLSLSRVRSNELILIIARC